MYLLNLFFVTVKAKIFNDLHSTMYLLNPVTQNGDVTNTNRFTFHYVSIKSTYIQFNMHDVDKFTFHYVSIKSLVHT